MSNLSELLPAGAGAKSAEFVASGTLGSGVTVATELDVIGTGSAPTWPDELGEFEGLVVGLDEGLDVGLCVG